jgi:hypothetical protein
MRYMLYAQALIFRDGIYRLTYFDNVLEYRLTKLILERGKFRSDTTTNRSKQTNQMFLRRHDNSRTSALRISLSMTRRQ